MFAAIFIYSSREGDPGEPSAMHSDVTLEMLWTVIPAVILVAITVPTVHTIIRTQPDKWPADTLEVRVIAHQWWWEFKYPIARCAKRPTKSTSRAIVRSTSQ